MTDDAAPRLEFETQVRARPESVFAFFTDHDKHQSWMGIGAQIDPRPGGVYEIDMGPNGTVQGEFVVVDPPRRIVFTWGWQGNDRLPPGSTSVEVTFTPSDTGTLVRLTHSGLPTELIRAKHTEGWTRFLPLLAEAAAEQT